ncbi:MAG: hypothetical protein A2Y33_16525 [Spirochaetes bacterium GWF1_51_8]|nr:MAG: hypothetical protein A2Y33_16525 [Spirochaetes bacterium GWF1_51_8]
MVAVKKTVRIPENHKISIEVPEYVRTDQMGEVILIINDAKSAEDKSTELKQAMNDPLFLDDLNELRKDFEDLDSNGW